MTSRQPKLHLKLTVSSLSAHSGIGPRSAPKDFSPGVPRADASGRDMVGSRLRHGWARGVGTP
jgi:hypothetical protein